MSDINELADRDPLSLSARDIDDIIAYQRKARANYEAGGKAKPEKSTVKIDLVALGLVAKPEPMKRRI